MKRSSWMLQGDRAVSMQNAIAFLQRQQDGSQTSAQAIPTPNPALGRKHKELQWNGFDAVTGRRLEEIRAKKRTLRVDE